MSNNNKRFKQHQNEDDVPEDYLRAIKSIGNTPEDIERWRNERKRRFPRTAILTCSFANKPPVPAAVSALSAMFAAYASDEEEEPLPCAVVDKSDVALPAQEQPAVSINNQGRKPCTHFTRFGRCKYGARCHYAHDATAAVATTTTTSASTATDEPECFDDDQHISKKSRSRQKETFVNVDSNCSSSQRHHHEHQQQQQQHKPRESLLRKLLSDEIAKETKILLECVSYIVARNFFEEPKDEVK